MLVNYGRQVIYHRAGNLVECRYCVNAIGSARVPDGWIWCVEHERQQMPADHCTAFWREPGSDDA